MEKYSSPHLRLHGNPRLEAGGKTAHGVEKIGAKHGEEELHRPAGAEHMPEHVTKTHPGETQPHPHTGVHAVHAHHVGGGKYLTHTHHQDGSVATDHHENIQEVKNHFDEHFPTAEGDDQQHDQNAENDEYAGGGSLANMMDSLGGEKA